MQVTNMTSNKGNFIPNQFIINGGYDGNMYFQSYKSMIAKIDKFGKVFLDSYYWNYSRTTSKYRNQF